MSLRPLPDFLRRGDAELQSLMPGPRDDCARMRNMMGMGRLELRPVEGSAAADWLRHVEAGRIGCNSA